LTYLNFLVLGIGNGAVFGALALTIIIAYRASGVVNFAVGAMALYGGYVFAMLRQGQYLVPIPGLPTSISLGGGLSLAPALLITVFTTAILGMLLDLCIFRPLRSRPPIVSTISSVGVLLVIPSLLAVRIGTLTVASAPIFPRSTYKLGRLSVAADKFWLLITIILLGLGVAALYRWTRFGLATRAVAETTIGASASGIRTSAVALTNWALSGAVAGLAGALLSPLVPLAPQSYAYIVVPALAAVLAARFRSVTIALAVGIAIGMIESELAYLPVRFSWLPQRGLSDLVPLVVILVVLLVTTEFGSQQRVIIREAGNSFPLVGHRVLMSASIFAVGAVLILAGHGELRLATITSCAFAFIGLSYVVVVGLAGQMSLAQLSLAGVGAYGVCAISKAGIPFPIAPFLACVAAASLGILIGLPSLRLRGIGVAVATLSLAIALQALWFHNPQLDGGAFGASPVAPKIFGIDLGTGVGSSYPRPVFGLGCLAVLGLATYAVLRLRASKYGLGMLAVRANQKSATACGINVVRVKVSAFGIAGFLAGLGGVALAYLWSYVSNSSFDAYNALPLLANSYIAGITSVVGGVVSGGIGPGGLAQTYTGHAIGSVAWFQLIGGIGLIACLRKEPDGIVGGLRRLLGRRQVVAPVGEETDGVLADSLTTAFLSSRPTTSATSEGDVLRAVQMSVSYGGVLAVDHVDISVPAGTIVGLIGPNGAGKTTLVDAITGFAQGTGEVDYHGEQVHGWPAYQLARHGLVRTFQGVELWHELSVGENVEVGSLAAESRRHGTEAMATDAALALMGLRGLKDSLVGDLSYGERQRVSIARALAAGPEVLILDEPAAGLDSVESIDLQGRLQAIAASGVAILLIDHDMDLVLTVCEMVYVLDLGRMLACGSPQSIRSDPAVLEAYLGAVSAAAPVGGVH
jgi:ABC-type branched-subunit amino acid transport system ATPase component/branched-subunit amino acid ABC-type transport system permease component